MEKELDVILFNCSIKGAVPTAICDELYPYLESTYMNYSQVLNQLRRYKQEEKNNISIAFAYGISNGIDTNFIFEYQKKNPNIIIEIQEWSEEVCIQKLQKNEIDIAFLVNPFNPKNLNSFILLEDYIYIAVHKDHPLSNFTKPINISYLEGETIITGSKENSLRQLFDYFCNLTNIKPHIKISSSYSLNYINSMVENIGITTVTAAMARKINNPSISIHQLITPEPGYLYCCTSQLIKNNDATNDLLKYLRILFKTGSTSLLYK